MSAAFQNGLAVLSVWLIGNGRRGFATVIKTDAANCMNQQRSQPSSYNIDQGRRYVPRSRDRRRTAYCRIDLRLFWEQKARARSTSSILRRVPSQWRGPIHLPSSLPMYASGRGMVQRLSTRSALCRVTCRRSSLQRSPTSASRASTLLPSSPSRSLMVTWQVLCRALGQLRRTRKLRFVGFIVIGDTKAQSGVRGDRQLGRCCESPPSSSAVPS